MKRALAAVAALALFLLSACGPLPRPFGRDDGDAGNHLAQGIFYEGVEVQPVAGTTLPMGKLIADAVIRGLEKEYEIPAAASGFDGSQYVLSGTVVDNEGKPDAASLIDINWQLTARDGAVLESFVQNVDTSRLEWDYGAAPLLKRIGEDISTRVARLVLGERFGSAGQDRLLGKSGLLIGAVEGAPGDGNASLRRAMAVALGGGGIKLTNDPHKALFTLSGEVTMGAPDGNAQSVKILWLVKDLDGKVLGRAEQANVVTAGSLDGTWGRTAAFVAAAATEGIITVVERNDPTRLRGPDLGAPRPPRVLPSSSSPPPVYPDLKQVPGRALPPPS
jgi:hypothetical protein